MRACINCMVESTTQLTKNLYFFIKMIQYKYTDKNTQKKSKISQIFWSELPASFFVFIWNIDALGKIPWSFAGIICWLGTFF